MTNESRILPRGTWWAVLALILCIAAALRYTGYNFSLPYIDHPDEPSYLLAARMVIDDGSPKLLGMQGYPPGLIALNTVMLRLFQEPSEAPTTLLPAIRLISITFSMGVLVLVGLLGYRVGSPIAGLAAAMLWAVAPKIVEFSRYATADNYVTFFALLALFLTLTGTRFNRNGWIYAGAIAIMLAIVFKYQAVLLLPLIVAFPLVRLFRREVARQIVINEFGRVMLLIGAFGIWLLLVFPALEAGQSPNWSAPSARLGSPSPDVLLWNFNMVLQPLARTPLWVVGALGLLLMLLKRVHTSARPLDTAAVVLGLLCWIGGGSMYGALGSEEFRQFVTVAALATILVGVGLSLLMSALLSLWKSALPMVVKFAPGLLLALVAVFSSRDLEASVRNAHERSLPDQRNLLTAWVDSSLPPGGYIGQNEVHKVFNPDWGGYVGMHDYSFIEMAALTERPVAEWISRGAEYAIVRYQDFDQLPEDILSETLRLRTFPPDENLTGPAMVIVRLMPMQHEAGVRLGTVQLVGYDLSSEVAKAGDTIEFRHYWRADLPLPAGYNVFNHLLDADGALVAQVDGLPMPDARRTTDTWSYPDETLIGSLFTLTVPDDIATGDYQLVSGFYRLDTGERLVVGGVDSLPVLQLRVVD